VKVLRSVWFTILHTPGHTPGSQCFLVQHRLVSGDTLFIGSCGRVDLPNSSPEDMYHSLTHTLMRLDDQTVLYPGHNYTRQPTSTIGAERRQNPYVQHASLHDFLRAMGY
jgi:glyoxylase-like metal-dependent hydrolase (beta-lactamase superfamily II)